MSEKIEDFYFSNKSFIEFELGILKENELVKECYIDGEWFLFTEAIDKGRKPLSVWEDLKYVGESNITRYTRASEWIKERINEYYGK